MFIIGGEYMKKIISIILVNIIMLSSFFITAFAEEADIWDFVFSYFSNQYFYNNVAPDTEKLIDFWQTYPGKALTLKNLLAPGVSPLYTYQAIHDLDEAADGRYMVGQLNRNQVEGIVNSFQEYWSSNSSEIRNVSLADVNITFDSNVRIQQFGLIQGSGSAARLNSDSQYIYFQPNFPSNVDSYTIYVYNGSAYYPPVIYFNNSNLVQQNGVSLSGGYYYVLNASELLSAGASSYGADMYFKYKRNDGVITSCYTYRVSIQTSKIVSNGVYHTVGDSGEFSYAECVSKFSMAVGLHISTDNLIEEDFYLKGPDPQIPYDDNDNVVVMLPMDNPGQPVYLPPATYNNYINNGNIDNSDDHSNNIVNNDDVENITNIVNNYYNNTYNNNYNFDDTNILAKLDTIITKLDDIINKLNRFNPLSESSNEPIYDNFSDCIFQNVPIADDIHDLIDSMNTESSNSGFDNISLASSNSNIVPSRASGNGSSGIDYSTTFSGLGVDMSWYDPYRANVRGILEIFVYSFGLVAIWSSVKSVFGIHNSGGE